jgi:hypothetical protein
MPHSKLFVTSKQFRFQAVFLEISKIDTFSLNLAGYPPRDKSDILVNRLQYWYRYLRCLVKKIVTRYLTRYKLHRLLLLIKCTGH